jgi:hypothetical protein
LPVNLWFFCVGVVANVLPPTPAAVEHHGGTPGGKGYR